MQLYLNYAAEIYSIYLDDFCKEDIFVYSVDEAFIDITGYTAMYHKTPHEMARFLLGEIERRLGLPATCGIGTNLYLAKIALDITAKHAPDRIGALDEAAFRTTLWDHTPLTDFWRIGHGIERRLLRMGLSTMGDIAHAPYKAILRLHLRAEVHLVKAFGGKHAARGALTEKIGIIKIQERIADDIALLLSVSCRIDGGILFHEIHIEFHDVGLVETTLQNILDAYERDFAKHPDQTTFPKLNLVWSSLPAQLAKENKRFLYNVVKKGARAREYEDALQWLVNAQLLCKVPRITAPGLPISAYDDLSAFKIYAADVGLLRRMSHLSPTIFAEGSRLFREFKGALTENYVLEALTSQFEVLPRYWSRLNPSYEVDFILQRENNIFPIEVKAEDNVRGTRLRKYAETFPEQTRLRLRFSLANLHLDGDLLNIPLFMIDQADRLIELALRQS